MERNFTLVAAVGLIGLQHVPFPRSPTVSLFRCCRRAIATIPRMLKIVGQLLIVVVALAASADTTMQTETVVGRPARLARNNPYGSCRHYHDHQCSNDHLVIQRHNIINLLPWFIWNLQPSPIFNPLSSDLGSWNRIQPF